MKPTWKLRLELQSQLTDSQIYEKACYLACVEPSARKLAKWRRGIGNVYFYKKKAIKKLVSEGLIQRLVSKGLIQRC